jgi:hypothetical protein
MIAFRFSYRLIAAAAMTCAVGAANATITIATIAGTGTGLENVATFAASVNGSIDTFGRTPGLGGPTDLVINQDLTVTSLTRSTGPAASPIVGYTVSTETGLFTIAATSYGGPALSVSGPTDTLTFSGFQSDVVALGIHFYLSDLGSNAVGGTEGLRVIAKDLNGETSAPFTFTQSASTNPWRPVLVTVVSTSPLESVQFLAPVGTSIDDAVYATVDSLVLAAVPETSTWMMMLAGVGAVLRLGARRRG